MILARNQELFHLQRNYSPGSIELLRPVNINQLIA